MTEKNRSRIWLFSKRGRMFRWNCTRLSWTSLGSKSILRPQESFHRWYRTVAIGGSPLAVHKYLVSIRVESSHVCSRPSCLLQWRGLRLVWLFKKTLLMTNIILPAELFHVWSQLRRICREITLALIRRKCSPESARINYFLGALSVGRGRLPYKKLPLERTPLFWPNNVRCSSLDSGPKSPKRSRNVVFEPTSRIAYVLSESEDVVQFSKKMNYRLILFWGMSL